jgi:hypothetical protein
VPSELKESLWIDVLNRKHECGPTYSSPLPLEISLDGETYRVLTPDVLPDPDRLEIKATFVSEHLLMLIGRHTLADEDDPYERGILMIARHVENRTYAVHVWHELFPQALKMLGLNDEP